MGKKQGSTRTTISVPADLKARMDKVMEPVNWSALACRAFEDWLGQIAAKKETKSMSDVVERLRASMRSKESQAYKNGLKAGKHWAEQEAEVGELARLEQWKDSIEREPSLPDWETYCTVVDPRQRQGVGATMAEIIAGETLDWTGVRDWWETNLGDDSAKVDDGTFVRGFVDGALDVWEAVKDEL
jgi:hypothetical protein